MIVSVSRRTDIPAFYGEWFARRLRAGEVLVRNPINRKQISSIPLRKENVDCFVFWTKDPGPFLKYLDEVDGTGIPYYFTITINPYGRDIERNVRRRGEIIESVRALAGRIGRPRLIWRYDPILFSDRIDRNYHLKWFGYLAGELSAAAEKCVFSFLTDYDKIRDNMNELGVRLPDDFERREMVASLAEIASDHSLALASCAQSDDYSDLGVEHNSCIDPILIEKICGYPMKSQRDTGQRPGCKCVKSRDIGTYNTCLHNCLYCYANRDRNSTEKLVSTYDPESPMLCDRLMGNETVSDPGYSLSQRNGQQNLFS